AGTAQRIALNLLSSLVMILLGRVYEGLMVDLQAVNEKLVRRSEAILTRLTGRSIGEARDALQRADGGVKRAVWRLPGCARDAAADFLDRSGGQLRAALALIGRPAPDPVALHQAAPVESPVMHDGVGSDDPQASRVDSDGDAR